EEAPGGAAPAGVRAELAASDALGKEVRMALLHRFRRRRWLVVAGAVAVATPAIFLVTGVTASGQAPAVSHATPLVDRDYIYGQLFDMSYNDVYRVSGADGDPRNPNDPFNLP